MKKILVAVSSVFGSFAGLISSAHAQISTTTLDTLADNMTASVWDYVSTILNAVYPFAIGFAVLGGMVYFILRRTHIIR